MQLARLKYPITVRRMLLFALLFGACSGILFRQIRTARENAKKSGDAGLCLGNLNIIGIALHQYFNEYGSYPPAYIADANGKPLHSWRVLVLASAGYPARSVYDDYNFNEPWDGPNNRKLADRMSVLYGCPAEYSRHGNAFTSYLAVTGSGTAFSDGSPSLKQDIHKHYNDTIMIAEVAESGILWMEPRDLDIDHMNLRIQGKTPLSISSMHQVGPAVILGNGMVRRLDTSAAVIKLKQMLTGAGANNH